MAERKKGNFSSQWYRVKWWRKFLCENCEKRFLNEKKCLQERSSGTSSTRIFSCLYMRAVNSLLKSYYTAAFIVQFGINLHLWNCTRRSGSYNFRFLKNSLVKIELETIWAIQIANVFMDKFLRQQRWKEYPREKNKKMPEVW